MYNIKYQKANIKNKKPINIFLFLIYILISCFLILNFLYNTSNCFAEDIEFEAIVDKNVVSLGSSIQLSLHFQGTQKVSAPKLPDIDGFNWQYLGPATKVSIVNGSVSSSITHNYILIPLKTGTLQIPSFSFEYDAKTYTSPPISIEVTQGSYPSAPSLPQNLPQSQNNKPQSLEDRIFVIMQVDKRKAYLNEIIPLTIKLYVNRLAVKDIQYPEISHPGFSVGKFSEPKQYQDVLNGVPYDVIEFTTDIFALQTGELTLGPASLKCNLVVKKQSQRQPRSIFDQDFFDSGFFDEFFGRSEAYPLDLKSISIPVNILPLPTANVPPGYKGAMGSFNFSLEAEPREVKTGDPITLKMTITGSGNFNSVNPPEFKPGDNFKVYEPDIRQAQASKTFEQVIIPKNENITEIPEVSFSFFDVTTGEYKTLTKGPIPIKVNPLPKGEELKIFDTKEDEAGLISKKEVLGRDIIYIKDSPGNFEKRGMFLCKNRLFMAIQFFPLLLIILIWVLQRRKERLATDIRYARSLMASPKAKKNLKLAYRSLNLRETTKFFDTVFKTLQEYLGDKFHLPSAGITVNIVEELKSYKINPDTLVKIKQCFNRCDTARYASGNITKDEMQKTFDILEEIIDELEKIKL